MLKNQVWSTCILVVDDDDDIRMVLADQLLALGYEVCLAANGPGCVKTREASILHLSNGGVCDERIYSRRRSPPSDVVSRTIG